MEATCHSWQGGLSHVGDGVERRVSAARSVLSGRRCSAPLWGRRGYAAVRVLLAVVFFVAAALKGHELATGPLLGDGLLASRPVLIALVEFEWVLGLCMLFGLYPKWTWQVALACFSVFACVSLYKGLAGDASCGCFGRLEVSPWYTLALDVGAVIYCKDGGTSADTCASIANPASFCGDCALDEVASGWTTVSSCDCKDP